MGSFLWKSVCFVLLTFLTKQSCAQSACANVTCRNGGACVEIDVNTTNCNCVSGFNGDMCQIDLQLVNETLERHNEYRAFHGAPLLTHNVRVSAIAQAWADYLGSNNKFEHSTFDGRKLDGQFTGENLAWAFIPGGILDGKAATTLWYNEVLFYNYQDPGFTLETGHFTQVVWTDTTQIGVGRAQQSSGAWVIVVQYFPVGNFGSPSDFAANVNLFDMPNGTHCPFLIDSHDLTSNLFNIKNDQQGTVHEIDLTEATNRMWGVALQQSENGSKVIIQHTRSTDEAYLVSKLCFWVRKVDSVRVAFLNKNAQEVFAETLNDTLSYKFEKYCLATLPANGKTANTIQFDITPLPHVTLSFFRYMDVEACAK